MKTIRKRSILKACAASIFIAGLLRLSLPVEAQYTFTNLHSFSIFPDGASPQTLALNPNDGSFYGATAGGGTNAAGTVYRVTTNGVITILYEFTGKTDGAGPLAGLVLANDGKFYGTTSQGGTNGSGTVFSVTTNGAFNHLYSFSGSADGASPEGGLVQGVDFNFYGTAMEGGAGHGTVFSITATGSLTHLYSFTGGGDGALPEAGLALGNDGEFYGTTRSGGTNNNGAVFKITTNGVLTRLYSFTGRFDGAFPEAGLALGTDGSFYGTTFQGGTSERGTIFKIATNGVLTSLYSFPPPNTAGILPVGGLVLASDGNFYGTTQAGGANGFGTVFKFTTTNGTVARLYSFTGGNEGATPRSALVQGQDGNLYGAAVAGGQNVGYGAGGFLYNISTSGSFHQFYAFPGVNDGQLPSALVQASDGNYYGTSQDGGAKGSGNVFQVTPGGTVTSLYSFTGGNDGAVPDAALIPGPNGFLYGTTESGDANDEGTVFSVSTTGVLTTLHSFTGYIDGGGPIAPLVLGGDGNLYGTTSTGGFNDGTGGGTLFKITPQGAFATLYTFTGGADGGSPAGLLAGANGTFYGTTSAGGSMFGTVFSFTGGVLTTLHSFTGDNDGGAPMASLVQGGDGNLYGTTSQGGDGGGNGTIFRITPAGTFTNLYSFQGSTDGDNPSGLLAGTDGSFYGASFDGGNFGYGAIFKFTPGATNVVVLYSFTGLGDGGLPTAALAQGTNGSLYGTTFIGAAGGYGDVFRLSSALLPAPGAIITSGPISPPLTLVGFPAMLGVDALGAPPLSYQWKRNGVALTAGGDFSGVNNAILTIDPAAMGDAGTYSVTVSNYYGVATSSNVVVAVLADTNAAEDYTAGTNYLAMDDLISANLSLSTALGLSGTNANYLFFAAVANVLSLPDQPAGSNFLNRLGLGSAGRDIYDWVASEPTNANGHLAIPITTPPLNLDEFTAQLRTNVLPALAASETDLGLIVNTNFTVDLTAAETRGGAVTVDWGDVEMLQAMGNAAELFIYTTYSWNMNIQLLSLSNSLHGDKSFEQFLTNYPSLLTTTSTADLPAAKGAFTNAILEYFAASQFIRGRPAGQTRLFNLDTNQAQTELQFRETLSNLLASLNGPVPLTVAPAYSVSAQALFGGGFDPRAYLPDFQSNELIWDTFPDTSFGGIISGLNEFTTGKGFLKRFKTEATLDRPGTALTVLYDFTNTFGQNGLVQGPDGTFYGTMLYGGPNTGSDQFLGIGFGTVFKITPGGQFSTLYSFGSNLGPDSGIALDGAYPNALIMASDGNLYGTTEAGGSNAYGSIFKITPGGQFTNLYSFGGGGPDLEASSPVAALVQGTNGLLYGTTETGGAYGQGEIFSISTSGSFTLLASFPSYLFTNSVIGSGVTNLFTTLLYPNGVNPETPLIQASDGKLYGTTAGGGVAGTNMSALTGTNAIVGFGTIFTVDPTSGQLTTLYTFGTHRDGNGDPLDGALPNGLVQGSDGNLYGTAQYGGSNDDNSLGAFGGVSQGSGTGDGTLFCLSPTTPGMFTNILSFDENFGDGYNPIGSLVPGPGSSFYGVASAGGANKKGAIFVFNADGVATNIVWLDNSSGGYDNRLSLFVNYRYSIASINYTGRNLAAPIPSLLMTGQGGNVYGITTDEGVYGSGTLFQLNAGGVNGVYVTVSSPANGDSFSAPAAFSLSANVITVATNTAVSFFSGTNLLTTISTPPYSVAISNLAAGTYIFTALASNTFGTASDVSYVTVNVPGTTLIDFDPLDTSGNTAVTGQTLANYLALYGVSTTNNSAGTVVAAQNQANVAGGGFVLAPSQPNVLTQVSPGGTVSFSVGFAELLSQFSFTRPQLLANPFVTHPAWQAEAFDPLGNLLDVVQEAQISSFTNVPAAAFTLTGGSIASVEFISDGIGLDTFHALLLDNFDLTPGSATNLPPAVAIISPAGGQVFSTSAVPISVETVAGSGTVTSVTYYYNGTFLTNASSPFSIVWNAPNGSYSLTAVAVNNSGLSGTSAPVAITVANGFAVVTPPASQTIAVGNNATFTVTTTGANASYQWQFDGTNIVGANQSSYAVSNAAAGAAGNYDVVVTSGANSITSAAAALTVLGPPGLGATSVITNGNNLVLTVLASDSVPFYSQWQLNGNGIAGATNSYGAGTNVAISYTITNARAFNSGNYQVVVANTVASVESPVFTVAVGPTPISTNGNFASSLAVGPFTNLVGYAGVNNSSNSIPPASGPTLIAGKPAAGFLWYNWQATFSGVISLTTRGSTFDTLMGVYTGTSLNNLTLVAQDDDSGGFFTSLVTFNCVQGTTYQIVVAGYQGATGTVELGLSPGPAAGLPGPAGGYSVGPPQPVITRQPANQVVLAGATVTLSATVGNATSYQWFFAGVPVTGGNSNILVITNFMASEVGNYFLQVSNTVGSVQSTIVAVELATTNQNGSTPNTLLVDKFGDAVDLTTAGTSRYRPNDAGGDTGGFTLSQSFSTVGATKEQGEPNHAGQPGGASYWYTYTTITNGTLQFDTIGSTFSTILALYTGPGASFSTLTNVGADYTTNYLEDGQPAIVLSNVVAGTRYFIAIDGYLGASGAAKLNVGLPPVIVSGNTNAGPITNNTPVVAISSPANNYLTTVSNINARGTVRAAGGKLPAGTLVQLAVNTNAFAATGLQAGNWFTNITLVPGANVITVQSITVLSSNLEFASVPVTRTIFYDATAPSAKIKAPVTLLVSGSGKITGQVNQASLEIGKVYTVNAVPAAKNVFVSWSSGTNATNLSFLADSASLAFDMSSNLILQAAFTNNPFTNFAGSYNGLFSPAGGVTEESSGYFTATLPATGHGAYSAKVMVDGGSYAFSGSFNLAGDAGQVVTRPGKASLSVALNLDLPATNDQITGTVTEIASNGWTSGLVANRAATTVPSAEYTMLLPPDTANTNTLPPDGSPGGDGYALITNHAGLAKITGALADGTALSQSVPVSQDGYVPVYANLYSSKGLLLGWINLELTNANAVVMSSLTWIAPARTTKAAAYPNGFTNVLLTNQILLSLWTNAPAALGQLTNFFVFDTIDDTNALTNIPVATTIAGGTGKVAGLQVSGAINLKTGAIKVTVGRGASASIGYGAVLLNNLTNSGGYLLAKPTPEAFKLTP